MDTGHIAQPPTASVADSRTPSDRRIARLVWRLFLIVPAATLPLALPLLWTQIGDLLLFVGLPAAGMCWLITLAVRLLIRRTKKGLSVFAFKSAIILLVSVTVIHFWLPAIAGGGRVWRAGVFIRMKLTSDVPALREWAAAQTICFQNIFQDTYPRAVCRFHPDDVWVGGHVVRLTMYEGFGTVQLMVGPKGMPPTDGPWMGDAKPMRLEDGAYVLCSGPWGE